MKQLSDLNGGRNRLEASDVHGVHSGRWGGGIQPFNAETIHRELGCIASRCDAAMRAMQLIGAPLQIDKSTVLSAQTDPLPSGWPPPETPTTNTDSTLHHTNTSTSTTNTKVVADAVAESADTPAGGKPTPSRCRICNKFFPSKRKLHTHLASVHVQPRKFAGASGKKSREARTAKRAKIEHRDGQSRSPHMVLDMRKSD